MTRTALQLQIDHAASVTLQTQIVEQIIALVRTNKLSPNDALPGSRELSRQLGVSRNTVAEAYEKLSVEGYITTTPAKGTFIQNVIPEATTGTGAIALLDRRSALIPTNLPRPYAARGMPGLYQKPDPSIRIDFRFGRSDAQSFPQKIWRRLLVECLGGAAERISQYDDPSGLMELRQELVNTLQASRGLQITPEQVVVVGGFQQGINLAAHLLVGVNTAVVMEAPCYRGAAFLFESYGGTVIPVPVDDDGIDVTRLPSQPCKLIYVTPSHQFPTGVTMPIERRVPLLEWAARAGAYILEVDYDSDFRYEGSLLPARVRSKVMQSSCGS